MVARGYDRRVISALLLIVGLAQDPVAWGTDLEAATARAERDGRPLLLVFR
jgi:hypothetical protein